MDIYTQKSRWKVYLAVAGIIIMIISLWYTNYLAQRLRESERSKVELYGKTLESLAKDTENFDRDVTFETEVLNILNNIPVILVDESGKIFGGNNFGPEKDSDTTFLKKELKSIIDKGGEPIKGFGGYADKIYYKPSRLITLLSYFPLVQVLLFLAFAGIGYMALSSARRAEQNRVWVGMAKETAHQLGTPISAIVAWIEHLKDLTSGDNETQEVLGELESDVQRLDLIAERFSKIGSSPELKPVDIFSEIKICCDYMKKRSSRRIVFEYPQPGRETLHVSINPPLFDWVVENILRNALDAMDGEGKISVDITDTDGQVEIDLTDTGKGIPASKLKTVFQPGYTTKQRGWGLGLSLAKRIIEQYHKGRIYVKSSTVNKGTTFTILLPKA